MPYLCHMHLIRWLLNGVESDIQNVPQVCHQWACDSTYSFQIFSEFHETKDFFGLPMTRTCARIIVWNLGLPKKRWLTKTGSRNPWHLLALNTLLLLLGSLIITYNYILLYPQKNGSQKPVTTEDFRVTSVVDAWMLNLLVLPPDVYGRYVRWYVPSCFFV